MINQVKTVVIAGCTGSMGQQTVQLIQNLPGFELVGVTHHMPSPKHLIIWSLIS